MTKPSPGALAPFILSIVFAAMVLTGVQTQSHTSQAGTTSAAKGGPAAALSATPHEAKQKNLAMLISHRYKVEPRFAREVVDMAHDAASKQGVDPVLLLALVGVESSFKPDAISRANARGLTQVIAKWHPEKVRPIVARGHSIMEPKTNLALGAQILAEYHRKFKGNRVLALQQYNGSLKDGSRKYSRKVISVYDFLSRDPSRT